MSKVLPVAVVNSVVSEKSGDVVYFNVNFRNDNPDYIPREMKFSETRTTPLLPGNTQDYIMSVVKFDIPTDQIPIQIFPTLDGSLNDSDYTVTISWNGFDRRVRLVWSTQDDLATIPSPPYSSSQKSFYLRYYSLVTFEHFMSLINQALLAAHGAIVSDGAPANPDQPPFLYYDSNTRLISLYGPPAYVSNAFPPIQIFFNSSLYSNFRNSLPNVFTNLTDPLGKDFQLLVINKNFVNDVVVNGLHYFIMTQEFSALSLMFSFTAIILTTNGLPIRNEWLNFQGTNTNGYLGILSEFSVIFDTGLELRNNVIYLPTAQFRYTTLQSNLPIQNIDMQFFWKSKTGELFPIYLSAFREGTVKILFEKK